MKNFFLTLVAFPFFTLLTACGALLGNQVSDEDPCAAPDSTYAYSLQQEWKSLTYDLVFCWAAEEIETEDGQTVLHLEKGDGSAWVQITLMSGIPQEEKPAPIVTQNEDGTTTYVYEGHFTVVTNAPDDTNVQSILYSLSRETLEGPEPLIWNGVKLPEIEGVAWAGYDTSLSFSIPPSSDPELHYSEPDVKSVNYRSGGVPLARVDVISEEPDFETYIQVHYENRAWQDAGFEVGEVETSTFEGKVYESATFDTWGEFGSSKNTIYWIVHDSVNFYIEIFEAGSSYEDQILSIFLTP